ncbi:MAG TPA: sulfite exporter TauE/SafE family protein [Dongiaceae bacterium]|nr:sulfite exporter TauE/SafE family protein [Dongiaceae bacterium]
MAIDILHLSALVLSGIAAGFINTLAGGGSLFTLPALMLLGMPADIANGTNRIGVFLQSAAGVLGFRRYGKLEQTALVPILIPSVLGALIGSLTASYVPPTILKPALLGTMMTMMVLVLLKPSTFPAAGETPFTVAEKPAAWGWLFVTGLYGGFVQAGVGFLLLTVLAGILRYDLVRANALKMACTMVFGLLPLMVFIVRDQVVWLPGLVVGISTIIGVQLSVKFAVTAHQTTLKWIFLGMGMLVCLAALLK